MGKVRKAVTVSNGTIGLGLAAILYALLQGKLFTAAFGLLAVLLGLLGRFGNRE